MDRSSLSKAIAVTVVIWLGVFFVFAAAAVTAVAVAFASIPLFSFLILVGLTASSLAANLYWTKSRHSPPDYPSEQQLHVVTAAEASASHRAVRFQNTALSEPCLFSEPLTEPKRSFSTPRLVVRRASFSRPRESVTSTAEAHARGTAQEQGQDEVHAEKNHSDDVTPEEVVGDIQDRFSKMETPQGIWPVTLSEIGFSCSPDAPASWKEGAWTWNNVSEANSTEGATMALLSDASGSRKEVTAGGSEHDYIFESTQGIPWNEGVAHTDVAIWSWNIENSDNVGSGEAFQQRLGVGTTCTTPDDVTGREAHAPADGVQTDEQCAYRESPQESGTVVEPSTLSLIKTKCPIVLNAMDTTQNVSSCGKQFKKRSKKKFKMVSRFFKGKKKEVARCN